MWLSKSLSHRRPYMSNFLSSSAATSEFSDTCESGRLRDGLTGFMKPFWPQGIQLRQVQWRLTKTRVEFQPINEAVFGPHWLLASGRVWRSAPVSFHWSPIRG